MKKSIKCGIVAAVAVAAGFAAYQSYGSYGARNNNLLMQNVEALAQSTKPNEPDGDPGSGGKEKGTCGQKTKEYGTKGAVKCPKCHMETGLFGTEYSYQKNGSLTSYKEGFVGKKVECSPYCGMTTIYSEKDLVTKSCN